MKENEKNQIQFSFVSSEFLCGCGYVAVSRYLQCDGSGEVLVCWMRLVDCLSGIYQLYKAVK